MHVAVIVFMCSGFSSVCSSLVGFKDLPFPWSGFSRSQNWVLDRRWYILSFLLGDDEMLHLLLSESANVDPLSLIGSPLQMAASKANKKAVKILLDNGSNPDLFFPHVETPLVASILAKSLCCLEHLIKAGPNPIALSGSVAPLGVATSEGEVEMVQCLLEAGAIPDVTDKYGLTAIELAALKGNQRIVQILYSVTSKISTYPDWSIHGIMKDASSELARKQIFYNHVDMCMKQYAQHLENNLEFIN